jgi:hypothetical protein
MRDAIEFVRLGYGDNFGLHFRSPYFRTDELKTDEAQAVMRIIDEYNRFDGKKVADAIEQYRGRIAAYEFGRESSPVLYIQLPHWTHHREGSAPGTMGTPIGDAEYHALVAELRDTFVGKLGADEFGTDEFERGELDKVVASLAPLVGNLSADRVDAGEGVKLKVRNRKIRVWWD